jgi:hypothetical protein
MIKVNKQTTTAIILGLLCIGSFITLAALFTGYVSEKNRIVSGAKQTAEQMALGAATKIEQQVSNLSEAERIAEEFSDSDILSNQQNIEDKLKVEARKFPKVSAFTVAFNPESVPDSIPPPKGKSYETPLYSPYTWWEGDAVTIIRVEDTYDYTLPDPSSTPGCDVIGGPIPPRCDGTRTIWYHAPLNADRPVWSEPYFGSSGAFYWVGFGAPFYNTDPNDGQKVQAGMISADMTLDDIQNMVASLTPGNPGDGYGFIVSGRGVFVSHPIDKYVAQRKTLSDFDPSLSVEYLEDSLKATAGKRILVFDHVDSSSNQTSWVFFAPVKNAGWWIGISLDKEQILRSSGFLSEERKSLGRIVSASIIFLSSALALIFKVHTGDTRRLWYTTISLSLLFIAGIVFLWHMNLGDDPGEREQNLELADPAITAKVVADIAESIETLSESKAVEIPIGAFLRSIEFSGGDRTTVAGYIWHENPDASPSAPKVEAIAHGFTLPDAQEIDIREIYRREEGGQTTVGSNFSALIRQRFDFTKYPFDRDDIRIRIWPSEFSDTVFLSPDLDSYAATDPETLPGLDQEMVLEGWDISRSFFSYRSSNYNTNFGISNFKSTVDSLELYFNVSLRRSFITPLLSNFIPIGVVALLLFAVLATTSTDAGVTQRFGFTTAAILGLSAGLFFVVIIAHINLRDDLATQGVIYLESFYFVLYGAILVIALNSLLVTSNVQFQVLRYRDNLIPKLLYWPVIMLISFIVTLFAFT